MTPPTLHLVTHMGHDGPWLLIKTAKEIRKRRAHIRTQKPEHERALRLRLLKIVKAPLPPQLFKADAAWAKADAAWVKADAAYYKASAAWDKVINSPEGVKFHAQVCGCAWTPEQPDILRQLPQYQKEN